MVNFWVVFLILTENLFRRQIREKPKFYDKTFISEVDRLDPSLDASGRFVSSILRVSIDRLPLRGVLNWLVGKSSSIVSSKDTSELSSKVSSKVSSDFIGFRRRGRLGVATEFVRFNEQARTRRDLEPVFLSWFFGNDDLANIYIQWRTLFWT